MIPARQFVTSTNPFADDVQARLALPFHKPWVKSFPKYQPVLQPMPSLEDMPRTKGYMDGGMITENPNHRTIFNYMNKYKDLLDFGQALQNLR